MEKKKKETFDYQEFEDTLCDIFDLDLSNCLFRSTKGIIMLYHLVKLMRDRLLDGKYPSRFDLKAYKWHIKILLRYLS